jgi:arylsulfatase A-like enzyme
MTRKIILLTIALLALQLAGAAQQPNVIIVITDDQGYGDIGAHGNTMIQTPEMDKLWAQGVRLTDYHVDPTCTPSRSALLSGRYSNRTGIWHTVMGRSMMSPNETTMAEVFKANGYATGMFGKWHLGDNYPTRPQDQGFEYVVMHGGGGVGQLPDWWDNNLNDDTYWRNGVPEQFSGYCTDIWFNEAIAFMKRNKNKRFFIYLSTNAPHAPFIVDERYSDPYKKKGVAANQSKFYGMITNIDENLGRLRQEMQALGVADDTILIFTTDNGTAAGTKSTSEWPGFTAGMKGKKGSEYDGGHRVPFFMHWPNGKLTGGRDVDQLTAHIDMVPTLVDLCGIKHPGGPEMDGVSLKPILYGDKKALRDRTLFVHSQRIPVPEKWRKTAVMTEQWRLVNNMGLYDIKKDPGQEDNLIDKHPEVAAQLAKKYDAWWDSLKPVFDEHVRIGLGAPEENPACLFAMDWLASEGKVPFSQGQVKSGMIANGPWAVDITRPGKYRFELYRWPKHLNREMDCKHAKIKIGDLEKEMPLKTSDTKAVFELELEKGPAFLQSWLTNFNDKAHGAYFLWVERIN